MAGGYDGIAPLASAEIYDISNRRFREVGSMQTARYRHTATPLNNGTVLIVGGEDAGGALATAELFQWTDYGIRAKGALLTDNSEGLL
jgi:N-acetylneuraminic acid mutarotase